MSEGKIIEYIEQGKLLCALCLQDKGTRLHLLTLLNRLVNLPSKRATFISPSHIPVDRPREELLSRLREIDSKRVSLKEEIKVKELWELIKDESESFNYKYLSQLCFGEEVTEDHISALIRALFDDKLFFKMKDGQFIPNSEEKIEGIIRQQEEETKKEEKLAAGSDWLKKALKEGAGTPETYDRIIVDTLIDLAIHGRDADEYKFGKELLERAGITDIGKARRILVKLGIWEEDEPLDLIRYNIRQSFSDEQLAQALAEQMQGPVHALALHTYAPEEWRLRQQEAPQSPECLGGSKTTLQSLGNADQPPHRRHDRTRDVELAPTLRPEIDQCLRCRCDLHPGRRRGPRSGLDDDTHRSPVDDVADEPVAVEPLTGERDEQRAGFQRSGIYGNAGCGPVRSRPAAGRRRRVATDELALVDQEIDPLEGLDLDLAGVVDLRDAGHLDDVPVRGAVVLLFLAWPVHDSVLSRIRSGRTILDPRFSLLVLHPPSDSETCDDEHRVSSIEYRVSSI